MGYLLTGQFVEACDCRLMCPCWTDDEPDDGHCTGLFAWTLDDGSTVDGVPVGGAQVVCVTAHLGRRRGESAQETTVSVLFVDTAGLADPVAFDLLGRAFSGRMLGPLADLAEVNGTVVLVDHATVAVTDAGGTVTVAVTDVAGVQPVLAVLDPARFDGLAPLTLQNTALSKELGIRDETVTAHHSDLTIRSAVLPGGFIEVTGRSGMRGPFHYQHKEKR